jgi:HSP20 family protein
MREEMDRMFEDMIPTLAWPSLQAEACLPAVDAFETADEIKVKAELPGLKKDDIEITATEDSICLKGEFKLEEHVKEEGFIRNERRSGKFCRTIPMPTEIKADQVKASFKDGILEITAPKSEKAFAKEKRVPIES